MKAKQGRAANAKTEEIRQRQAASPNAGQPTETNNTAAETRHLSI